MGLTIKEATENVPMIKPMAVLEISTADKYIGYMKKKAILEKTRKVRILMIASL
jgi:hypothetical protein